jgi:hypothetical protein
MMLRHSEHKCGEGRPAFVTAPASPCPNRRRLVHSRSGGLAADPARMDVAAVVYASMGQLACELNRSQLTVQRALPAAQPEDRRTNRTEVRQEDGNVNVTVHVATLFSCSLKR